MRIEPDGIIAGVSILKIRNFLKRNLFCNWDDATVRDFFKISYRKARHIIDELESDGYVERVKIDKEMYWKNTLKGNALAAAKAAKPILRTTADKKIEQFLERVAFVNRHEYFLYNVAEVTVFGSYLSNKERINDIDISISLAPKYTNVSSITKCNTWGSHAILSVYAKTL